uniref:Uncharacterized protein n=1 Tax=Oryza brachyantha TaxID=4533 RepID=J3M1U2_ORYBR
MKPWRWRRSSSVVIAMTRRCTRAIRFPFFLFKETITRCVFDVPCSLFFVQGWFHREEKCCISFDMNQDQYILNRDVWKSYM